LAKCGRRLGQGAFWGDKIGPNPTDRAKNGTKRSVICDEQGGALGATIEGANVHDTKLLERTIQSIVVKRPNPKKHPQHLCLDAGYDNPTGRQTVASHKYIAHIRPIRDEKPVPRGKKKHKPRRWVVERLMGWLSKCRAILVRYDKNAFNYLGLIQFACALFWFRRLNRMGIT
jgi:putative transposase